MQKPPKSLENEEKYIWSVKKQHVTEEKGNTYAHKGCTRHFLNIIAILDGILGRNARKDVYTLLIENIH